MKILAIRGKNLASLAGEFAVDFQSEPLASAGLYAITGATGAGKSTLLDALCLALYEKTPRLARANSRGDSIPDVGDERVAPGDPRNILRRGAAEGYAEVDFIGSDAVAYRARWSIRRSRDKANGKLQKSEVSLLRLGDEQVLSEHTKSDTIKLIERCVGLNFEQFTRAVLLAQNDFAAFLKASDDERAELLQTLTGTETFSRISQLAYQRAKEENEALKRLQTQLADQAPLAAELREQKDAERTARQGELNAIEQRQAALLGQLRWHQQGERLKATAAEAQQTLAQAQAAKLAAGERQAAFARIEAVQAARPLAAEVGRLAGEISAATQALASQQASLAAATQAVAAGKEPLAVATRLLAECERERAGLQVPLDLAKALDAQIVALSPNHQQAQKLQGELKQQLDGDNLRCQQLEKELAQVQAASQVGQQWLAQQAALQPLAEGWPRWQTLLAQATQALLDGRQRQAELVRLGKEEGEQADALLKANTQQAALVAAQQSAATALTAQTQACAAFNPEAMVADKQRLDSRREQLAAASQLLAQLIPQQQARQQLLDQQQALLAEDKDCDSQLQQLAVAKPLAERDLAAAEKSLRLAEVAASASVEQLRAGLQADSPCPVCGAEQHPYAEHNPALAGVLHALRDEVGQWRQALAELQQQSAALSARQQAARQRLAQLDKDSAQAAGQWENCRQQWAALPQAAELAALALPDAAAQQAWLAEQQAAAQAALAHWQQADAAYREAIRRKDAAQAAASQAQQALAAAHSALSACQLAHQKTAQARQTAQAQAAAGETLLAQAQDDLDAAFADAGWRAAWAADAPAFHAQCQAQVAAWHAQQKQLQALAERLTTLTATLQGARDASANASRQLAGQSEQVARLAQEVQAKQGERQALFAGRPVSEVEAAWAARIEQAKTALAQRQREAQEAEANATRLDATVRQSTAALAARQAALLAAQQALADWLAAFNAAAASALSPLELDELLAFAPDWLHGERQALQALDSAIASAAAVAEAQQRAHAAHLASQAEEAPWPVTVLELQEMLARAAPELEQAKSRLAALQVELGLDDERRQRSHSLLAELDRQTAQAQLWARLGDLIGSADGKKFRNFAQQLTLDILLGYANRHLESLSRRYRLERIRDSLGLLVVDQDMGDELRSVHSLSGGESFLLSLAMALGLASLSSHRVKVESLFIDEGFGSLDSDALLLAMEALDKLQAQGRKVGVISHVQEMTERIGTRIQIKRQAGGVSRVVVG